MVQEQVRRLLKSRLEPRLEAAAREVLAEAHFRAALSSDEPGERLSHLDAALQQTPDAAEAALLSGHRTLASRPRSLRRWSSSTPPRPASRTGEGWPTCAALARIATGKAWDTAGLTPAEANTLRLVQRLVRPEARQGSVTVEEPAAR